MRSDFVVYGPNHWYNADYFYNENGLNYGYSLNDSNDSISFGFQIDKTTTISGIGFYLIDIIGNPPNYQFGIVTISGTIGGVDSYPSDTLYGEGSWQTFNPITIGSGWSWINLNSQVSAIKGDFISLTIKPTGSAPDTNNYIEVNDESTWYSRNPGRWRYTSSWGRFEFMSTAALKYIDNTFLGIPIISHIHAFFNSPKEWGLEFKLPISAICVGASIEQYLADQDAPFKIILANSNDTELASLTVPSLDFIGGYDGGVAHISWDTSTNPALDANIVYRLYLKPTSSLDVIKNGFEFNEESDKTSQIGGTEWKWIERDTPASGWTYYPERYPWISVLLTDLSGESNGGNGGGEGGAAYGFIG